MIRRLEDWWRRRSRASAPPPPPAGSDDWRVGDLAECIHPGPWFAVGIWPVSGPELGSVHRVAALRDPILPNAKARGDVMLQFTRFAPRAWASAGFRKVQPRTELIEAADAAFIASLKPARVPEPVQ